LARNPVHVRDAVPQDAEALITIWADASRRAQPDREAEQRLEVVRAVARIAADADERLLVAVVVGEVVGAVHLRRTSVSPIYDDAAIHVMHLHVRHPWRRQGVGRALMEASVSWAEEKNTAHILAAASVASRDANRFMARLGLGQLAVVRGGPVGAVRAKLPVEPAAARIGNRSHRNVAQVLAERRSLRRARVHSS